MVTCKHVFPPIEFAIAGFVDSVGLFGGEIESERTLQQFVATSPMTFFVCVRVIVVGKRCGTFFSMWHLFDSKQYVVIFQTFNYNNSHRVI